MYREKYVASGCDVGIEPQAVGVLLLTAEHMQVLSRNQKTRYSKCPAVLRQVGRIERRIALAALVSIDFVEVKTLQRQPRAQSCRQLIKCFAAVAFAD